MKKALRTLAVLLTLAALFFCAACDKKDAGKLPEESGAPANNERFSSFLLEGVDITEYTVIIPEKASDCEKYAAEILTEFIEDKTGNELSVKSDKTAESDYEILIGRVSREDAAAANETPLQSSEYLIYFSGHSVILGGEGYMIGGGVGRLINEALSSAPSYNDGASVTVPAAREPSVYIPSEAKSVMLFIGDGMGRGAVSLAYTPSALVTNTDGTLQTLDSGAPETDAYKPGSGIFPAALYPNIGEAVTLNYDGTVTDSAASATALATGSKTKNEVLGMIPADLDGDGAALELKSVQNVREKAVLGGRTTAVLSTDRITGATPNAFLVHHSNRYDSDIVLEQQKELSAGALSCDTLWCSYDSDSLASEVKKALPAAGSENGFFMMCEEAMIDKYASRLDYYHTARSVKRLESALNYATVYAVAYTDTALIVTADHETGGITESVSGESTVFAFTSGGDHTAANVPVYAIGGGTEIFAGAVVDNTDIAAYIASVIE